MSVQDTESVSNTGAVVSDDSRFLFTEQADRWASGLSRTRYAVLLGASASIGVLAVGFLLSQTLFLLRALTIGVVMFGLEYTFEEFQTTDS